MFPGQNVYFCVVRFDYVYKKTLLELELENQFSDLPNVKVTGLFTFPSTALKDLHNEILSKAGSWFVDEITLPQPFHHSSVRSQVHSLVQHMRNQPDQPLLWMSVAGIEFGNQEHFEVDYLKALLHPLHVVEGMDSPLRNSLATLKLANLETGTSDSPLFVNGGNKCNVRWTIPHRLIPGVEGLTLVVQDKSDRVEVEDKVRQAREAIKLRMGHQGVPVLCGSEYSYDEYPWILASLAAARPGSQTLIYTSGDVKGQSQASEVEVAQWLHRMDKGLQEEDLVTDDELSRGWEAQCVLVVGILLG